MSCRVHGDLSGAGGSSCCGRGGHSSRLPPCCGSGGGSWGNLVRAPDVWSCPEEASASELAQEGFLFLWVVMSCPVCLALEGFSLSCLVLSCLFSPGGLLIPPDFPRETLGGVEGVPAVGAGPGGPRPRPRSPSAMASRAPSSAMATWAPCTAMASRAPSSAMVPVCLFRSGGPRPVFLSVFCPEGPPERPPLPSPPRWNC